MEAARPQIERAYGSEKQLKVEMAKLQVAMMCVLRMKETEVGEDGEIEQLQHELQHAQVRAFCATVGKIMTSPMHACSAC